MCTNLSLMRLREAIQSTSTDIFSSISEADKVIGNIGEIDVAKIDENNPGLRKSLLDLL